MDKPRVFVTRKIDQEALEKLAMEADVAVWPEENPPSHEEIISQAGLSDGLLTMLSDKIDEKVIQSVANRLKAVSQMAVGFDNIDVTYATRNKIPVFNTPSVLTNATADHTWALLMAAARRITEAHEEVHAGIWRPWGPDVLCGIEVTGATLGIIGFGRIGQAVARRAAGFEMKVQYFSKSEKTGIELNAIRVSLDELLKTSDFISLHVSLTPETFHLIGQKEFDLMKNGVVFINTSRGGVVDSNALRNALASSKVAAAGLDVFDPEPISMNDPILKMKNVVITPHIASATTKTRKKMAMIAVENLVAGLRGEKTENCVNPEIYTQP